MNMVIGNRFRSPSRPSAKLKEAGVMASAGALLCSVDSYLGQRQYIKQGEELLNDVLSRKSYRRLYKNNINKIRDTYMDIIKTKKISTKLLSQAALRGSLIFGFAYLVCRKSIEFIMNSNEKRAI